MMVNNAVSAEVFYSFMQNMSLICDADLSKICYSLTESIIALVDYCLKKSILSLLCSCIQKLGSGTIVYRVVCSYQRRK